MCRAEPSIFLPPAKKIMLWALNRHVCEASVHQLRTESGPAHSLALCWAPNEAQHMALTSVSAAFSLLHATSVPVALKNTLISSTGIFSRRAEAHQSLNKHTLGGRLNLIKVKPSRGLDGLIGSIRRFCGDRKPARLYKQNSQREAGLRRGVAPFDLLPDASAAICEASTNTQTRAHTQLKACAVTEGSVFLPVSATHNNNIPSFLWPAAPRDGSRIVSAWTHMVRIHTSRLIPSSLPPTPTPLHSTPLSICHFFSSAL